MSRTYRIYPECFLIANGVLYTWEEWKKVREYESRLRSPINPSKLLYPKVGWMQPVPSDGWRHVYKYDYKQRDSKPWNKPTKEFKQIRRRAERSRVKNTIRGWLSSGMYDKILPAFKRSDSWDWV